MQGSLFFYVFRANAAQVDLHNISSLFNMTSH